MLLVKNTGKKRTTKEVDKNDKMDQNNITTYLPPPLACPNPPKLVLGCEVVAAPKPPNGLLVAAPKRPKNNFPDNSVLKRSRTTDLVDLLRPQSP